MFGNHGTTPEYSRREELGQGIVRYSNRARRLATVVFMSIPVIAAALLLFKGGPEAPVIMVFLFPLWILFGVFLRWSRRELILDRESGRLKSVITPLLGDVETWEIGAGESPRLELRKEEAWELWIHLAGNRSRFIDSSDEEMVMRRLAKDLSDVLPTSAPVL